MLCRNIAFESKSCITVPKTEASKLVSVEIAKSVYRKAVENFLFPKSGFPLDGWTAALLKA